MTTAKDRERQEIEEATARFRGEVKTLPDEVAVSETETRYHLGTIGGRILAPDPHNTPGVRGRPKPADDDGQRAFHARVNKKIRWLKKVKLTNDAKRKIKATTL